MAQLPFMGHPTEWTHINDPRNIPDDDFDTDAARKRLADLLLLTGFAEHLGHPYMADLEGGNDGPLWEIIELEKKLEFGPFNRLSYPPATLLNTVMMEHFQSSALMQIFRERS